MCLFRNPSSEKTKRELEVEAIEESFSVITEGPTCDASRKAGDGLVFAALVELQSFEERDLGSSGPSGGA